MHHAPQPSGAAKMGVGARLHGLDGAATARVESRDLFSRATANARRSRFVSQQRAILRAISPRPRARLLAELLRSALRAAEPVLPFARRRTDAMGRDARRAGAADSHGPALAASADRQGVLRARTRGRRDHRELRALPRRGLAAELRAAPPVRPVLPRAHAELAGRIRGVLRARDLPPPRRRTSRSLD